MPGGFLRRLVHEPLVHFAFNLGVELGQLAFVATALVLVLARALSGRWLSRATRAAAYGIGGTAAYWTIERTSAAVGWF